MVDIGNIKFEGKGIYILEKLIARGAMGEVYRAKVLDAPSEGFPTVVAIKTFPKQMGFSSRAQKREIESMRQIQHPNVVELYDWGITQSCYFMVIPFYPLGTLTEVLDKSGPLDPARGARLLRDIAEGLSAIHERGLLHLDIKPANILMADDGRFVLSDLGIASFQFLEYGSGLRGTPMFMSPEQARGESEKLDARSDLFCLGATLYYSLQTSAEIPDDTEDVLAIRRFSGLPTDGWKLPEAYDWLAEIVRKLLAFEPHKRFGSAYELIACLDLMESKFQEPSVRRSERGLTTDEETEPNLTLPERVGPRGKPVDQKWRQKLGRDVGDPVLRKLLSSSGAYFKLRLFPAGTPMCVEDERSFDVFILLHGTVRIERNKKLLAVENRVGSVMGEVAALIGKPRTATLMAEKDVVCVLINGSELEQAARKMPSLAVRIMKTLAMHLHERDQKSLKKSGLEDSQQNTEDL